MPRSLNAARKHRARFSDAVRQFAHARLEHATFPDHVLRLVRSDLCVWAVAATAADLTHTPLDDEERAVIAQVVAPRLAGSSRGQVERRYLRAKVATAY